MAASIGRQLRYLLEYAGLRSGLFLFERLPLRTAEAMGCFLADRYYRLNASRRLTAKENIRRSGIATDPREVERIARASFRSFALVVVEAIRFNRLLAGDRWKEKSSIDVAPRTMALFQQPEQGVIMVSGHLGNWEVGSRLLSLVTPLTVVARRMNNPYVDRIVDKRNAGTRVKLTPKRGADARRFLRALGRGDALVLVVDQHAARHGVMVDFFGTPASTYPTPALLHLRTRAPLVVGYCLRTGPMAHRLVVGDPIVCDPTGDHARDVQSILETLNRQLEKTIRQNPEQYLWAHRRWKAPNTSSTPAM